MLQENASTTLTWFWRVRALIVTPMQIYFRERLEFLAQKLADALGLSERGRT